MKYENAKDVLPKELLDEILKYVAEGFLYIPAMSQRKKWGSLSGQRSMLEMRNQAIKKEYLNGKTINEIENEYFLSQSTIYRIVK
jgi:DNA-binding NarL/FixJ family response regulator